MPNYSNPNTLNIGNYSSLDLARNRARSRLSRCPTETVLLRNRARSRMSRCPTGQHQVFPLRNRARARLSRCLTGQYVAVPLRNIRLPRCLTGQDQSHPDAQLGSSEAVLLRNWSTVEAVLLRNKHIKAFLYRVL